MKPPSKTVGKAGTKGTKSLPDGAAVAVRPFPINLFKPAFGSPHDLGLILTPAQMAASVPPGGRWKEMTLDAAADKALAALVGYGPKQPAPHLDTAEALARGLSALRDFALAGDLDAMRALGFVLSQAVADLAEMARRDPALVREWSRKLSVVPVLAGKNIGHRKELAQTLDAFAVGEASPYRVNPPRGKKTLDCSTPANALAGQLCHHLATYRVLAPVLAKPLPPWVELASGLPELSKGTWRRWERAAWICLLDATAGRPEENEALIKLGPKAARKDGLKGKGTLASNIRAEIRETLKEAIQGLARSAISTPSE